MRVKRLVGVRPEENPIFFIEDVTVNSGAWGRSEDEMSVCGAIMVKEAGAREEILVNKLEGGPPVLATIGELDWAALDGECCFIRARGLATCQCISQIIQA